MKQILLMKIYFYRSTNKTEFVLNNKVASNNTCIKYNLISICC